MEVAAALLGAAIGASTHAAKAGTRLAVNASPEPASNIAISLFEDGFVVGLVLLLITHPLLGLGLALVALLAVAVVLWVLLRVLLRRRRARREHRVR
jgi:flagellar biosynthesis/type III secretory pathway M-ring protein FliF/YscJ